MCCQHTWLMADHSVVPGFISSSSLPSLLSVRLICRGSCEELFDAMLMVTCMQAVKL